MFDQQPVVSLAAEAISLHAHEDPAPVQAVSGQLEFQLARLQLLRGRGLTLGGPGAAVPQLDGAAAVFSARNGPLEITVVERVILDLDGQAFLRRVQGGPSRHRPRFEDPVELESQIVVQAPRGVLLDDEAQVRRTGDTLLAAGFRGLGEIPLGSVG